MDDILGFAPIPFWIVVTCALVNVACGVLGCFLVLRRMSLLGDAISHAILPGLAVGFLVTHSRAALPMLAGAMAAGVLTAVLAQAIARYAKVNEDAAMGVVYTSLFALGVALISQIGHVDLDPNCVLNGILETAALDTDNVRGLEVPRIAMKMAAACVAVIFFVTLLWKELQIVSFDPQLATTLGLRAGLVHYLLMGMVAAVTVAAFEAVGSILVVAMLIVPAATAHLLTDRLLWMVLLAGLAGVGAALLGRISAAHLETSVAGMVAVVAGIQFALAAFFAPRYGYIGKKVQQWRLSLRIVREDILALLFRFHEMAPGRQLERSQVLAAIGGGLLPRAALWLLLRSGAVRAQGGGVALSAAGEDQARGLVRLHRLWETYLYKHVGIAHDHLHLGADRVEHFLDEDLRREVAAQVENAGQDPHGKPIPPKR